MDQKKRDKTLYILFSSFLVLFFILRIYLSKYLTLYGDLNTFIGWGNKIAKVGFSEFYSTYWCDYMPVYLYVLRLLNYVHSIFPDISKEILYKLPANIGDLLITVIIFFILKRVTTLKKSVFFSILYFINPAVLANSTFWGQIDTLHVLPIIVSALFALSRSHFLSGVFFTIAFLTKPQAIIILPILVIANFSPRGDVEFSRKKFAKGLLSFGFSVICTVFIVTLPFVYKGLNFPLDLIVSPSSFIIERFFGSYEQYKYASLNAFNFWGIFAMWESDQTKFLELTYQTWGTAIFFGLYFALFASLIRFYRSPGGNSYKNKHLVLFSSISIVFLLAFLFLTRAHERHLITAIVLSTFFIYRSRQFLYYYLIISFIYVLNLIYAYVKLTSRNKEFSQSFFKPIIFVLSSLLILILIFHIIDFFKDAGNSSTIKDWIKAKISILKKSFIYKNAVVLSLVFLFLVSFGLKVNDLGKPTRYYFDEVYYAFTAQEMAKGNPLGWQKGERAPGKVEYEWTHPPLGKELSALGILIFGDKPFSWRISQTIIGALGTIFIFLLARALFNSAGAGLFAAFLYTFESFIFVLSRIGMVDIFLLNFIIISSFFFVKYVRENRFFFLILTAVFCGASMSVKWTGALVGVFLFGLTILIIIYRKYFLKSEEQNIYYSLIRVVAVFLIVPLLVYISTYIPFLLNGNSFADLISLQETMFNYHTNVSKQHAYRSEWWSWPLMLRPVCLYIEKFGHYREYIYALGNPAIWWSGVLFLLFGVYYSIRKRYYPLIFVILSFLVFWLPWAISPRKITYIYHYLPCLPFLILMMAFFLDKAWKLSLKVRLLIVYFLICIVITFIFFYPILSAQKIPRKELRDYKWMKKNWTYVLPAEKFTYKRYV